MEPMVSSLMNKKQYDWLEAIPSSMDKKTEQFLHMIDKKGWNAVKKNLIAQYAIEHQLMDQEPRKIEKSNEFKKFKEDKKASLSSQLVLCSLMIMMTGTMLVYFFNAILRQNYVINFSIDAIVGSIALVLFVRNELLKYRLTKIYLNTKDYFLFDLIALVLCILLKIMIAHFDVSLIVFIAIYFFSKRRWTKQINTIFDGD